MDLSLDNFEGPLELLLYLIQKEEVDIFEVPLKEITAQFADAVPEMERLDEGAETLSIASLLLVLKSRKLLPTENNSPPVEEEGRLALIEQLLAHHRFRQTAETLSRKEEQARAHFLRLPPPLPKKTREGLEEVTLSELAVIFSDLLRRIPKPPSNLNPEEWQVAHFIDWLNLQIQERSQIPFNELFSENKCREELIVLFLALLELMKMQTLHIIKQDNTLYARHT